MDWKCTDRSGRDLHLIVSGQLLSMEQLPLQKIHTILKYIEIKLL